MFTVKTYVGTGEGRNFVTVKTDSSILTDSEISNLIHSPKTIDVESWRSAKYKTKRGHYEKNIRFTGPVVDEEYTLFVRYSQRNPLDFSAGLLYHIPRSNEKVVLVRCNGKSHNHTNHIEGVKVHYNYHIHYAKNRYLKWGNGKETYAEQTDRYQTLEQALKTLLDICNIVIGNPKDGRLPI